LTVDDDWPWGFLIIVGLFAWFFWVPYSWTNAVWYAVKYRVSIDQVHTDDKPSDCDWGRAPLGNKACHFKAVVTAYNAAGVVVGGDDAPKYGHDSKTGQPIVSYDDGKTWAWLPASAIPDPKIKTVTIRWAKVTD
jgi:hypothetical protein